MESNNYPAAIERSRDYFEPRIRVYSDRAYDYGILVVKNAFLVSGGELLAVPAIAGLTENIDATYAVRAGVLFAASVLLTLFINYVIHVNWSYHYQIWVTYSEIDAIRLRRSMQCPQEDDQVREVQLEKSVKRDLRAIWITFWLPHVSIAVYLLLCGLA